VNAARASPDGAATSGFLDVGGRRLLAIATPVCAVTFGCEAVGAALAALDLGERR
jgi:hypothetical protein